MTTSFYGEACKPGREKCFLTVDIIIVNQIGD